MIKMVTAIPKNLAMEFRKNGVIWHNTMPQLNDRFIEETKRFMMENTGYNDYPVACMSKIRGRDVAIQAAADGLADYIPVRANESIIFELAMPKDAIVSIDYNELLRINSEISLASDKEDLQYVVEELYSALVVGMQEVDDVVSFVSGLALSRCKFFTVLDSDFNVSDFDFPGVEQVKLNNLNTFRR